MNDIWQTFLDEALPQVQRPAQYIGGEFNSVVKDHAAVDVTLALAFPDTYTIGMSNQGMQILYAIANAREDIAAERVFTPEIDMEQQLCACGLPLMSLETHTPLSRFDLVGFSLQYEMCYTNVLTMLDLGGIPLLAAERSDAGPIVIAGGPGSFSPEPMAGFIDAFVVGDGETALLELLDAFKSARAEGASRAEMLLHLARTVPAVYVPSLYDVAYNADGTIAAIEPKVGGVPARVKTAIVPDLDLAPIAEKLVIPFPEAVHDRVTLEISRGCTQGCRFCQAGMIKRPVRPRSADLLVEQAEDCIAASGYKEVSLASLSSSDYPELGGLLERLSARLDPQRVNIALPSLRVDDTLADLPASLNSVRKSGITVAPEAATERLRRVINKNITDEDLIGGVRAAFEAGWSGVKLYFMIGLPTETLDDVKAIAQVAEGISRMRREMGGSNAKVNLSVAPFVPKPHTPFQWEPMLRPGEMVDRQTLIRTSLTVRKVQLKGHNVERSFIEGVFARGDRRMGAAILHAWKSGCRLDAWDETFDFDKWIAAFNETGIDPEWYACRERSEDETLPWDHIDAGVTKRFLLAERDRAQRGEPTPDCRTGACRVCGLEDICPNSSVPSVAEGS